MLGDDILYQHITAGGSHCCQICTCLDLIGDNGVAAALELFHATDLHGIRTGAGDPGAHGIEEVGQVHDVGLLGSILNNSLAGKQTSCHHI